jgi:hypothetical protein
MQSFSLNERQSKELCDEIGKMLLKQLDSPEVSDKVYDVISDFIEQNGLEADAEELAKKISWAVKVELEKSP